MGASHYKLIRWKFAFYAPSIHEAPPNGIEQFCFLRAKKIPPAKTNPEQLRRVAGAGAAP
jgi:hypothetical protein